MLHIRLLLAAILFATTTSTRPARAQDAAIGPTNEVAEAWLVDAVKSEVSYDDYGRFIALGVFGVIGGFLLVAPALIADDRAEIGPRGAAISMTAGAVMMAGAVGSLFIGNPHHAQRLSALCAAVSLLGLSAALAVSSLEAHTFLPELASDRITGRPPGTLSTIYGVGLLFATVRFGEAVSSLVVDLALPSQSPSSLREQIARVSAEARYDRIREYLLRQDEQRAWKAYISAAANTLAGALTMFAAQRSATQLGQDSGNWVGLTMIAYGIGSLIPYWFSRDAVSRLDAGEYPE
jgi:VIT1/CCC1 family predicted Fe2+/Mn2+ transporter